MGRQARRAAEVADIFRRWRDGKFRDDSLFSVLRSTAFAGVERYGRGCNPRPARTGMIHPREGRGVNGQKMGIN